MEISKQLKIEDVRCGRHWGRSNISIIGIPKEKNQTQELGKISEDIIYENLLEIKTCTYRLKEHIALGKMTQNDKYQDICWWENTASKVNKTIMSPFR